MATYLLYGLHSSTSSVSSSEGWTGQPTLNFPTNGNQRPSKDTEGCIFTNGEYLEFSSIFDNQGAEYITVNIWMKKSDNHLGKFMQVGHNFADPSYAQGTGGISLESYRDDNKEKIRPRVNGDIMNGASETFKNGTWLQIGFGWGKDKGYFKLKHISGGDEDNNRTHTVSSWASVNDGYYIGCKDWICNGDAVFTIHSIRVFSDELPGVGEDLYGAPYNQWYSSCGNGTRDSSEECDDGNYDNGDGCDDQCDVEDNWQCSGGTNSTPDTCSRVCSSNSAPSDEAVDCYDNNTNDSDGCSSLCKVETGYTCAWHNGDDRSYCTDKCGDGKTITTMPVTYCDDGDTDSGDGCSNSCQVESGWTCSGGSVSTTDTCTEICGDGKVINPTANYCDDDDNDNNDGCSSTCAVEAGWTCTTGDSTTASSCSDACGDGKVMNPQSGYCDDGDNDDGDGCSSTCQVESGWNCTLGDSSTASVCTDHCGDGKVVKTIANYCDDGDTDNNDGCSSTCQIEAGWTCTAGDSNTASSCSDTCGDGKVMNPQAGYCDDGDNDDGDGCDASCAVEADWNCSLGDSSTASNCYDKCGDGKVVQTGANYCDDGDQDGGDGCSNTCQIESGWDCTAGDANTASSCTETCGDGKVFNPTSGYCDDSNSDDNDGCSSTCSVEPGWNCTLGDSSTASVCTDSCGDGVVMKTAANWCDDGNSDDGDGCDSSCAIESYWSCTAGSSGTSSVCTEICGDGRVIVPTAGYCDDGDTDDGDGCSSNCAVESDWSCTLGDSTTASVCSDACGNGKVINPTAGYCDDGNKDDNDGCSSSCLVESGWSCTLGDSSTASVCSDICGDGKVMVATSGYCDDGGTTSGDGCSDLCQIESGFTCTSGDSSTASTCSEICGDGVVLNPTTGYCDDGNTIDGDGCSSTCAVEANASCTLGDYQTKSICNDICGDGIITGSNSSSSYCDDGNTVDGDGCSSTCETEEGYVCEGGSSESKSVCKTCSVDNCSKCVSDSIEKCETCDDGYELNNDKCSKPSTSVSASASSASQAAVGGIAAAAAINSVLNMSSPTVLWAMANQLQLLLLLILTKSALPDEIIEFITGNKFASFSLDFLPLENLPGIGIPKSWFQRSQDNENLSKIGIESSSTFYNNFTLVLILIILAPTHLCVLCMPKCKKVAYSESKCKSRAGKIYLSTKEFLYELFHFTIYLRLVLEAYQFLMLGSISEIYHMNYTDYASYSISCCFLLICIFILFLSLYMYSSTKKFYDGEQHYHCKEIVRGLKNTKGARLYTFFLLLRRFVLVIWLIGLKEYNKYFLIFFLSVFQILYLSRMLYSRPFENTCDNLVEITNEMFFTIACCSLIHLNTEKAWEGSNTKNYLYLLISNNLVVVSIMFGNLLRKLIIKCKQKCSQDKRTSPKPPLKVPQNTPIQVTPKPKFQAPVQKLATSSISISRISSQQMLKSTQEIKSTKVPNEGIIIRKIQPGSPKKPVV